jgi:predicted alpha/beta-fold hydrolase
MPVIEKSEFRSPFWLRSAHWQTILPALLRNPNPPAYTRERISTRDDDFLDLDFVYNGHERIVVLAHGLEGHSDKYYMRGMANHFLSNGWDTLSWNCRSCSGTLNLQPKLYHHGATEDLEDVVEHVRKKHYKSIVLLGFSLGGSLVVKYLGEKGNTVPGEIQSAIAIAVPCQLGSCATELSNPANAFYLKRFLGKLKAKVRRKAEQFPHLFDVAGIDEISSFQQFDARFSAPMYGFSSVQDFYNYASAGNYIDGIRIPTLMVNSLNDPMFPDDCYPFEAAKRSKYFFLETPGSGGHMGFWRPGRKVSWIEHRALQFVLEMQG